MGGSRQGCVVGVLDLRAGWSEAGPFGGCGSGHAIARGRKLVA